MDTEDKIYAALHAGDTVGLQRLMLEDRKRLSIVTPFGSLLRYAATFNQLEIVKLLVEELGADVNEGLYDDSPPYAAASDGHPDVARYLVDRKARFDVSDPTRNPLFAAIYGGHSDIVLMLLDAGIDPDVRYSGTSMENMDALAFARERGQKDIEALLLTDRQRRGVTDNQATGRKMPGPAPPHAQIIEHMAKHFGSVKSLALREILPTTSVPVAIHVIRESPDDGMVLFTTGMSDQPQMVPEGQESNRYTELMMRLPTDWPLDKLDDERYGWPFRLLRQIAAYPHEQQTWLGGPFALISNGEPPEPLGAGTQMSYMLLLRETPDVNPICLQDGRTIVVYALTPLYQEERDLETKDGIVALLERPQSKWISKVLDPTRPNAAL